MITYYSVASHKEIYGAAFAAPIYFNINTPVASEGTLLHSTAFAAVPHRGCIIIPLPNQHGSKVQVGNKQGMFVQDTVIGCSLPLAKNALHSPYNHV